MFASTTPLAPPPPKHRAVLLAQPQTFLHKDAATPLAFANNVPINRTGPMSSYMYGGRRPMQGGSWNSFWGKVENEFANPSSYLSRGVNVASGAIGMASKLGKAFGGAKRGRSALDTDTEPDLPSRPSSRPRTRGPQPPQLAAYAARRAAERATAAAAPRFKMHYRGYAPGSDIPLPPRQGKPKGPRAPRSAKQLAHTEAMRQRLAGRSPRDQPGWQAWDAFRRAQKAAGVPFRQVVDAWRAQQGKGPKAKRIDEYSRYQALSSSGGPFQWHRVAPAAGTDTGKLNKFGKPIMTYPRAHTLSYMADGASRAYGTQWRDSAGTLHGSGYGMMGMHGRGMGY
jgi:hypothetical protein